MFTSDFSLTLLESVVLLKFMTDIQALTGIGTKNGKGRSILIAFLDDCGCSFILHQNNTTVGCFLEISSNVASETVSMNFSSYVHL